MRGTHNMSAAKAAKTLSVMRAQRGPAYARAATLSPKTISQRAMHWAFISMALLCLVFFAFASKAYAGETTVSKSFPAIDEIRIGALAHNAEGHGTEDGVDINAEILFGRPFWRHHNRWVDGFFRPRPHVGVSINTGDSTNQYYFGATWDVWLTNWMFIEASFGGVYHDGPLDEPGKASFGCELNFRESAALGFALDEQWRLLFMIDHMSNANLCDRNRGLTNAGVRLGYKLR